MARVALTCLTRTPKLESCTPESFMRCLLGMANTRMKDFFDKMVKAGLFKPDLDYRKAYTLQFVNKGMGLSLRK